MSLASQLESEGTVAHFATGGATVTFRGSLIAVDINRTPVVPTDRLGYPDFEARDLSEIEIQVADLPIAPKSGELIVDADGLRHRITRVKRINLVWHCWAEVKGAP